MTRNFTSLTYSNHLHEAGVFSTKFEAHYRELEFVFGNENKLSTSEPVPAWSASELRHAITAQYANTVRQKEPRYNSTTGLMQQEFIWEIYYRDRLVTHKTEADALAELLLHLLSNAVLHKKDVNYRLNSLK